MNNYFNMITMDHKELETVKEKHFSRKIMVLNFNP
jgi:hypothetical protein